MATVKALAEAFHPDKDAVKPGVVGAGSTGIFGFIIQACDDTKSKKVP
ncbi:hypothetical protein [Rhodoferax koreensis]|nr:hypothetical protein [Rhodoferax koreense]